MNQKTCKDCIHYEVCKYKDEKVSLGTKACELVADDFKCFKDKTRIVELPCKVGDTVYVLTSDAPKGIEKTYVEKIEITKGKTRFICKCVYDDWGNARWNFSYYSFGKTVFLSPEEAEKALERMKNENGKC